MTTAASPALTHVVQVLVRDKSPDSARAVAATIFNRYHEAHELVLDDKRLLFAGGLAMPQPIGEDERGRVLVSTNFTFTEVDYGITVSNFTVVNLGRTSIRIDYDASEPVACEVYVRTEGPPLGAWQETSFESSYHTTHTHLITGLSEGTWYHLYIHVYNQQGVDGYWPYGCCSGPGGYYRFKTGTATEPGIEDAIYET